MARTETSADVCDMFEISDRQLQRWVKKGVPHDGGGKGKPRKFNVDEVAAWMRDNNVGTDDPDDPDELRAAKIRKENALADKHEIAVEVSRGLLVEAEAVEREWIRIATVIRTKLESLPASVAASLEGRSAVEIEHVLDDRIREVLTELSQRR